MKMDFHHGVLAVGLSFALTGCGQPVSTATGFQELSSGCTSAAMPQQFVVKHVDGRMEVVRAASEDAFKSGYMKTHATEVQYAEHDFKVHGSAGGVKARESIPTVTSADNWGPITVHADTMWSQGQTGSGVVVAVVDSGMDISHPQLKPQLFLNPGENGTDSRGRNKATNNVDDDGNGYVDDAAGYDFVANQPLKGDYAGHGSHVSGIIGALHHDTVAQPAGYVEGMAPGVKILPLAFLNSEGAGSMSDGVRAIQYAVGRGAKIINASWGGTTCSQTLKDEIASLQNVGVTFVTAAGNDSADTDFSPEYPAALNFLSQLTIGATGDHDLMAGYSNYGVKTVHLFAPGSDVTSTIPGGLMGVMSGTSMATPMVSGAVALLLGAVPNATTAQLRTALYNSALHNSDYLNVSQGRLDMASALSELRAAVAASANVASIQK